MYYKNSKFILTVILAGFIGFIFASPSQAANFPNKPVSVTNCFPAGGGADRNIQAIKPFLEKYLGVSILLKYETGASNTLALQNLAIHNFSIPHDNFHPLFCHLIENILILCDQNQI